MTPTEGIKALAARSYMEEEPDPRKQTWCLDHYGALKQGVNAGVIEPVVLSLELVRAWERRMEAEGKMHVTKRWGGKRKLKPHEFTRLREDSNPLCCFMGHQAVAKLIEAHAKRRGGTPALLGLAPHETVVDELESETGEG